MQTNLSLIYSNGEKHLNVIALDSHFSLETVWRIPARPDLVWLYLADSEKWPQWWSYVESVEEITAGERSGIGNIRNYHWSTCLPYSLFLTMESIEIIPYRRLAVEVKGDLQGTGFCELRSNKLCQLTQVTFFWDVEVCKPWLKLLAIIAKPVFIWNHNRVMKQGERGLIRRINSNRLPA